MPEPGQYLRFIAEGAVFPAHIAVSIDVLGAHDLESDRVTRSPIQGIQNPRVVAQGESIDEVVDAIQVRELRHHGFQSQLLAAA